MARIGTRLGHVGVDLRGEGGTPLLFLHGVGSDKGAWAGQLDRFGRERLTLAIDAPGYGESDFLPGATRDTQAEAALAVMDALDIVSAHVCGLSLGGVVALGLHALAPERIASMILADTFAAHPEGPAILERSLAGLAAFGIRGLAEQRVDALLAQPADPAVRRQVIETMAALDPAAYALAAKAVWLANRRHQAAAVSCPTLILCGSEDQVTPPALSEELKHLIPHAALVEVAGAGHLPNLERPLTFDRTLAAFLAAIED